MDIDFSVLNKMNGTQTVEIPDMTQPPAVIDPFDPGPLVEVFKRFVIEIDRMDARAMAHEVKDDASCELATTLTTQAKTLGNTIEKKRKAVKEPYLKVTQTLDAFSKNLSDRLKGTQIILNNKIKPYLQKKERERREAEFKAQEAARKEQERLEAEARAEADRLAKEAMEKALAEGKAQEEAEKEAQAAAALVEPVPIVVAEAPEEVKVKTETGTADIKKEWAWEITDFKALPDDAYRNRCDEVTKALAPWLNARVKAGMREIPGVKIFQITKLQTRARK